MILRVYGSKYGGWVLPKDLSSDEKLVVYSAGAGEDITFEQELLKSYRGQIKSIKVIDPTPRAIKHYNRIVAQTKAADICNISPIPPDDKFEAYTFINYDFEIMKYIEVGLACISENKYFFPPTNPDHVSHNILNINSSKDNSSGFVAKCYSVKDLMRSEGDTHINILKMDIEGAEVATIYQMFADKIFPDYILVELDYFRLSKDPDANSDQDKFIKFIIGSGYTMISNYLNHSFKRNK